MAGELLFGERLGHYGLIAMFGKPSDWAFWYLRKAPELYRLIDCFKERVPRAVYLATAEDPIPALVAQEVRVVSLDRDLQWIAACE